MGNQDETITIRQWVELLSVHPELANHEVPWDKFHIDDWALLVQSQPQLEKFRPQLPEGSPYTLLSVAETIDLLQDFQKDYENFLKSKKK